jgi:DNA-binding CsgD family transcriptional regulator
MNFELPLEHRMRAGIKQSDAATFDLLLSNCAKEAALVYDISTFKQWIRNAVRPLLAHGALACVHGRIYGVGVDLDYVLTVDYPVEHLASIRNAAGHMDTPLARRWYEQQSPVFFEENKPWPDISAQWLEHFRRHGLVNAAADGVLDRIACIATYFSFHQLPALDEKELRPILNELLPILHETFTRVIRLHKESTAPLTDYYSFLTAREQEIAARISQGKSNPDIAALLGVSENTIRNHVSRILDKTGCGNRAGLAAAIISQEQHRFGMGTKVL